MGWGEGAGKSELGTYSKERRRQGAGSEVIK